MVEGIRAMGTHNLFVRNIKNKVKKERKLSDYEYPLAGGRGKKSGTHVDAIGVSDKCSVNDAVVDVEIVVLLEKKWFEFDMNNRFGAWKMMTVEEKAKITKAYELDGDRAVMWAGNASGVVVYFTDVKDLVRGDSVRGNVIDTYAEMLFTNQSQVDGGEEVVDKSYFFSSVCMDILRSSNMKSVEKYVLKKFSASKECWYIHFPVYHNMHWTLVVYDTEDRSWQHFNLMRQRSSRRTNVHYNEALVLKARMSNVMKGSLRKDGMDKMSIAETFNHPLEAVANCPEQKADSLDCAVIVCAIMR
ncbi:hypothetical protein CsSME_00013232 [Camellia sinensis var. sinensis]